MRKSPFIFALLLVACGGDGQSPPSGGSGVTPIAHAPEILALSLSPGTALYMEGGGQLLVSTELDFKDSGSDLQVMWVELQDGSRLEFAQAVDAATGALSEQFNIPTNKVGAFTINIWLMDKASNRSNLWSATFNVVADVQTDQWTRQAGDLPYVLNDVAWTGERFVAVGDDGHILTSTDGTDWVERQSGTDFGLEAVASLGQDVVAVGQDATVLLSKDGGETWAIKHNVELIRLAAVTMTPEQIVTGGMDQETGDAFMMRSLDGGETWRLVDSLPQSRHFITDLVSAAGRFVAATDTFAWYDDARVMVAWDGNLWNDIVLRSEVAASYAILYDGQRFIAAGINQAVFRSPDGFNWTELDVPIDRVDYLSAAWNGSRLVIAGGISWFYWWVETPAFERPVGLSSTDGGTTWEIFNIDGYYESRGMAWGNGRFVSVGRTTPASGIGAIYTSD
jgi:hypothetical protein